MKRKLGIAEGQLPEKNRWFFLLFDQADSAFGCLFVYYLFLPISLLTIMSSIVLGTCLHLLLNFLLYIVGVRKRPC